MGVEKDGFALKSGIWVVLPKGLGGTQYLGTALGILICSQYSIESIGTIKGTKR